MKKDEFRKYLSLFYASGTVEDKICYCNTAEAVLGCDLEDIVHDFNKIINAENKLSSEYSKVRKAFRDYIGFTYSPKPRASIPIPVSLPTTCICMNYPLVQYYDDVALIERDENLRKLVPEMSKMMCAQI